jgi:hypothetical protein
MRQTHYILEGHTPRAATLEEWARWFEKSQVERIVAHDTFKVDGGEVFISTVFLGLDHSLCGGVPMIFETMVFGGDHDGKQWRCSTWDQAVSQHKTALNEVLPKL